MPVARPERVHRQVIREPQLIAGRHLLGSDGERQIRAGVAKRNSFGPLSERQRVTMAELRARFFPEVQDDDLLPPSEPL